MEGYAGDGGGFTNGRGPSGKPKMLEASIYVGEGLNNNFGGISALYQKPAHQDDQEDVPDDPEDPSSARKGAASGFSSDLPYQPRMLETPKYSNLNGITSAEAAQKELRSILADKPRNSALPSDYQYRGDHRYRNAATSTELKSENWDLMSARTRASFADKETITDAEFEEIGICPCLSARYWNRFFRITNADFLKRMLFSFFFFRPTLANEISDKPDLYGPFWIYSTLKRNLIFELHPS